MRKVPVPQNYRQAVLKMLNTPALLFHYFKQLMQQRSVHRPTIEHYKMRVLIDFHFGIRGRRY
jgi:hypothetical protein